MSAKVISDKNFAISLKHEFSQALHQAAPKRVALLTTCEYEGIYRNGGIGTYYQTLSERLAEGNWYVILLLFCVQDKFLGGSSFPAVQHIFSTQALEEVLNLQPIHLNLLAEVKHDPREYESLCCLLFTQAITSTLPESQIYVEFPEMTGIGYRTIQAKHTGALGENCITAVTMHSGYEWVFEANERFVEEHPEPFWQIYYHEQASFEGANLVFFPSYALKQKVESYGWQATHAQHMPYFIPKIAL